MSFNKEILIVFFILDPSAMKCIGSVSFRIATDNLRSLFEVALLLPLHCHFDVGKAIGFP